MAITALADESTVARAAKELLHRIGEGGGDIDELGPKPVGRRGVILPIRGHRHLKALLRGPEPLLPRRQCVLSLVQLGPSELSLKAVDLCGVARLLCRGQ